MTRLSALAVAHSEAARLAGCLDRPAFADEVAIAVGLDHGGDGSHDTVTGCTDSFIEGAWEKARAEGRGHRRGQRWDDVAADFNAIKTRHEGLFK